jgi:RNA polymerase sigma factor (sigma-70 family)
MNRFSGTELDVLVARYLLGDTSLLPEIVALLQGPLYSIVMKCGVSHNDAADVVEQFFEDLFEKKIWKYTPRPNSTVWNWLSAAARNAAKDWRRQQARRPDVPASDLIETMDASRGLVSPDVEPPSPRMSVLLNAFGPAFGQLSEREQDLLRLRIVLDLDYETIADQFEPGLDADERARLANRLKTQFHRAREKVRKAMSLDPSVPRGLFENVARKESV